MTEENQKLVLIDGNAIIHRAYHALPKTMTTRAGEPTNATYGFTTTLIKVLEDLKPEFIACSFDLAGPTFRHKEFADYKATRVKADQELYDQIPRVKQIVETMGIPIYEKETFEADDILGTIAEKIKSEKLKVKNSGIDIYIVSGDKDIYQLINGNVKVYSLRKGLSQLQIVDHDTIKREYNLDPADFIDLKALAGDASDNIPGVPGIGSKTATDLIQKFDSLEKLYAYIDQKSNIKDQNDKDENQKEIKPRILNLLIENRDQAFMSQKLATIYRDVPIDFDLEKCRFGEYDKIKLTELFEELGFQSLLRRFEGEKSQITRNLRSDPVGKSQTNSKSEIPKKDEQLKLL
ncbi:MAG: hypothetical protein NTW79_02600 [Candidatus Berkelbacteria bacterium]|nr:hypothetical protein [Candidatus Berkelbacteria bacterium]